MVDWTYVQGNSTSTGSGTTNSLAFAAAVGNGNIVVGGLLLNSGSFVDPNTGITDDKGNKYRVIFQGDDTGGSLSVVAFRSLHPITNAPTTITATCSPSAASVFWILIDEFAPPTGTTDISLDAFCRALSTNGNTSNNFGTWRSDDLVYGINFCTGTSTTGTGFTAAQGSGTSLCSEWKIVASPTTGLNVSFTAPTATSFIFGFAIAPKPALWEVIQSSLQRTTMNATTGNVAFNFSASAGSIVVGSIAVADVTQVTSLQDDKSNNYTILTPNSNGRAIFWSNGIINNGPKTITVNLSASSSIVFLQADEVVPPPGTQSVIIDGSEVNLFVANTAGTTITSPNITTTHANDLGFSIDDAGASNSDNASGYTSYNGVGPLQGTSWTDGVAQLLTAGTYNTTWDLSASGSSANVFLVAFASITANPPPLLYRPIAFYPYSKALFLNNLVVQPPAIPAPLTIPPELDNPISFLPYGKAPFLNRLPVTSVPASVVIETNTYITGRQLPSQWNVNQSLLRGMAQDLSSLGVETNPHWQGRTWSLQWSPLRALVQNPALDVFVAASDNPSSVTPRQFSAQWNINKALWQITVQDFSSFGVETNPHWRGRIYPLQWNIKRDWAPPQDSSSFGVETNPHWAGRQWPVQWNLTFKLRQTDPQDLSSFGVETNPPWVGRSWPIVWTPLQALARFAATDVPIPAIETNIYFTPRTWPPQWNLQASLMRGAPQDFSSVAPAAQFQYLMNVGGMNIGINNPSNANSLG